MCILGIYMYPQISFASTNGGVPFLINNGKCPNPQELGEVSSDKGLLQALDTIIPKVYEGQHYKGWKVETIAHLPKSPHPKAYYGMANQDLLAYDAAHRQIFATKTKKGQWFAWFR